MWPLFGIFGILAFLCFFCDDKKKEGSSENNQFDERAAKEQIKNSPAMDFYPGLPKNSPIFDSNKDYGNNNQFVDVKLDDYYPNNVQSSGPNYFKSTQPKKNFMPTFGTIFR